MPSSVFLLLFQAESRTGEGRLRNAAIPDLDGLHDLRFHP
jgi:hypothetical protein